MKFSILIVNYNTEKYIVKLLSDFAVQTLPKSQWQVIVVNNCQNFVLAEALKPFSDSMN